MPGVGAADSEPLVSVAVAVALAWACAARSMLGLVAEASVAVSRTNI